MCSSDLSGPFLLLERKTVSYLCPMYGGAGRHDRRDTSDPSMGRYEAAADDPFYASYDSRRFFTAFYIL